MSDEQRGFAADLADDGGQFGEPPVCGVLSCWAEWPMLDRYPRCDTSGVEALWPNNLRSRQASLSELPQLYESPPPAGARTISGRAMYAKSSDFQPSSCPKGPLALPACDSEK